MSAVTRTRSTATAFVLVMAMVVLAAPVSAAEPTTRYVALGDSLAWGDGASDPGATGYVPLLADYFAGMPHGGAKRHTNFAVRGETTGSFIAGQLGPAISAISDASTDVRVVTLSIGGNDLLDLLNDPSDPCLADPSSQTCQVLVGSALMGVAQNYPVIMASLTNALAADPGSERVFVLTLYNPFGGTGHPLEAAVDAGLLGSDLRIDCGAIQNDPTAAGLNDVVGCTSIAFGATLVDSYPVIGDDALALTHIGDPTFNIHPNDAGYARIAKAHRTTP